MSSPTASAREQPDDPSIWRDRSARLFERLKRPAASMVRRAYGSTFGDDEIEDIYANAWVGTFRALERRHAGLDDDEIRSYLMTAVAHQASKEIRRRKRKPVSPIEKAAAVADSATPPDERADQAETSAITRDLLSSMPRRRRAVLLLRYGWGLEPAQVCELIEGLSPRAYRKEITKGIDQLTERIRSFERGEWCTDREPILKAFAAGLADPEQQRQAQHHLAHCRQCSDFVGKLSGHLHDLGTSVVAPAVIELASDGRLALSDRAAEVIERARDAVTGTFSRGSTTVAEASASGVSSATSRGAGAAGAGLVAKLAGLGAAGKATVACLGGGAAAAVCVAAGVGPVSFSDGKPKEGRGDRPEMRASLERDGSSRGISPSQLGFSEEMVTTATEPPSDEEPLPEPSPPQPEVPPPPPTDPPNDFVLAPPTSSSTAAGGGGGTRSEATAQEFGP